MEVCGWFPARHTMGGDPGLGGLRAFEHPAVREWHRWLLEEWEPGSRYMLVTPCSNVKPYTRSPAARKVVGVLRRLGLWSGDGPDRVEWVFLSDLLLFVPYRRVEEYPACCYELHPADLLSSRRHYEMVVDLLARIVERVAPLLDAVVVFLPRMHLGIWRDARERARSWPREVVVKYTIFSMRELEEALRRTIPRRGSLLEYLGGGASV